MTTRANRLKRLAVLEEPPKAGARRGLLLVPPILPLDRWEELAMAQQQTLANATRAGVDEPPAPRTVVKPDRPFWSKG